MKIIDYKKEMVKKTIDDIEYFYGNNYDINQEKLNVYFDFVADYYVKINSLYRFRKDMLIFFGNALEKQSDKIKVDISKLVNDMVDNEEIFTKGEQTEGFYFYKSKLKRRKRNNETKIISI